jgi:CHASE3 domain sensor protein
MSRRAGSTTPFVFGFLVLALAALAGNWQLDAARRAGRQAAASINDQLRLAEQSLSDLRGAQAGYLAAGQKPDEWMNRATASASALERAIAVLSTTPSSSSDARPHYDAAAALVAEQSANDRKARGFIEAGQQLVASDVLFQEGAEPARKLAAELAAARAAEMASCEKAATKFGWIGLAVNALAFAIGLLLIAMSVRARGAASAEASTESLNLNASHDAIERVNTATVETQNAAAPEPVIDPFVAPTVDLSSAAELCVDFGRILDGRDLQALMGRTAEVLEAKGLVLWVSEAGGTLLRPSVAYGYSDRVLQRMGTLPTGGDNVTSLAFRTMQPQVVRGSLQGHGALAVPLITANGCVGVLAAEVQGAKPGDVRFAVARMIAAQLSTLVGPGSITPSKTAASSN